ncbi:abhydrolase domain containing protein, putative [Entamoeba invadens IP1]|uniref:Abhydrolase domain containing protein, putative n=1 Tax=Entamoeba invadens IP1 TaxID=370355 RepID=A0A0A1UF81_ENTIV|nr:abhydrolase domain containing protein, putative [Entamoeba invadens IP1]ELP95250.1 abhydrolase domain containing protein, putative [Entamoeba invadens IP1]|eukprot:XP_004262021.1 abhydrolase domain containing protein, putative [Entamoeba invadens IP1]
METPVFLRSLFLSITLSFTDYILFASHRKLQTVQSVLLYAMVLTLLTFHLISFFIFFALFGVVIVLYSAQKNTPVIFHSPTKESEELSTHLSLTPFQLSPFLCDGALQTITVFLTKYPKNMSFTRRMVTGFDGGEFAVDWLDCQDTLPTTSPVIIIFHGLAGGSRESYVRRFADAANKEGYRVCVYTYRGCAGTLMKTPRAYNVTCLEDTETVISHVHQIYIESQIFLVGYSMGGMIVTSVLGRLEHLKEKCNLAGIVAVSSTWNSLSSSEYIPSAFMKGFTESLVKISKKNKNVFERAMKEGRIKLFDFGLMDYVKNIATFDKNFDCKIFGFGNNETYYSDIEQWYHLLPQSNIPFLAINAFDDPIAIIPDVTLGRIKNAVSVSKNVIFVVTNNGGHLGWEEKGKGITFVDKTTLEYFNALLGSNNKGVTK